MRRHCLFAPRLASHIVLAMGAACRAESAFEAHPTFDPAPILRLEAVSQTEVEGVVGTSVHVRPAVVVKDISGKPVKGILVMFTVSQLISSVLAPRGVITDAEGIAKVPEWVLGARAGVQTDRKSVV